MHNFAGMHRRWFSVMLMVLALLAASCQRPGSAEPPVGTTSSTAPAAPTATAEADSAPVDISAVTVLPAGDYTIGLDHDGRSRSYIVHVPERAPVPAPVVLAMHGGGGNGADFQEQNGMDAVSDREGFVVVYPEGSGILPNILHTWNSGDTCCGFAFDRQIDDVGFLRAVLADVSSRTAIDADRVYLTGHSNGAMMAYRFAVEAPELVTALAPVGGAAGLADPRPSQPLPLLHIHSADDPRALYDGGEGPPFPGTERVVHHEPVLPMVQTWANANGCGADTELVETRAGTGAMTGHSLERLTWIGCEPAAPVEHLVLYGSGHGWPGVTAPPLVQRHLGPATTITNASEEVWAFVSQFER